MGEMYETKSSALEARSSSTFAELIRSRNVIVFLVRFANFGMIFSFRTALLFLVTLELYLQKIIIILVI
jgi:hypothetical protein